MDPLAETQETQESIYRTDFSTGKFQKRHSQPITFKLAMDGSNLGQFSRDQLRFDPSLTRILNLWSLEPSDVALHLKLNAGVLVRFRKCTKPASYSICLWQSAVTPNPCFRRPVRPLSDPVLHLDRRDGGGDIYSKRQHPFVYVVLATTHLLGWVLRNHLSGWESQATQGFWVEDYYWVFGNCCFILPS